MKVLVTGGAGFIGSHLVERLLELGHEISVIDDLSAGGHEFAGFLRGHPRCALVESTILDRKTVDRLVQNNDCVFHLAAVLGVKNCVDDPVKIIEVNVGGTRNIVESCHARKKRLVFSSTSEVYGKNSELPFAEDRSDRVLGPTSIHRWSYATAKALDEHLCLGYAKKGLRVTVVRYFNTYGSRAEGTPYTGVVPIFINAALRGEPLLVHGDGRQTRCFTYVKDCVDGTIRALRKEAEGNVYNIGTTDEISIADMAAKIIQLSGSPSEIRLVAHETVYGTGYEDMQRRVPDLSKAYAVLGYDPQTSLDRGLLETISWHRRRLADKRSG
ncbi:MAG: NAD-dependent epimerase/dehydratase family protein [Bacilli bacterium]